MDIDASLEAWLFFDHVMNNNLGLNNNEDINSFLYPNPAKDSFSISSSIETISFVIYNVSGDKVLEGDYKINIEITSLSSGVYFVNIATNNSKSVKKLIVK